MAKAKKVSAATLMKLTRAAVKTVTADVPGRFGVGGVTSGFIPKNDLGAARNLEIASQITSELTSATRSAGFLAVKPMPVVVYRGGKIILGFIPPELR